MPTDLDEHLPEPRDHELEPAVDPRVSVMDWLLDVGGQVARRFRTAPVLLGAQERR